MAVASPVTGRCAVAVHESGPGLNGRKANTLGCALAGASAFARIPEGAVGRTKAIAAMKTDRAWFCGIVTRLSAAGWRLVDIARTRESANIGWNEDATPSPVFAFGRSS